MAHVFVVDIERPELTAEDRHHLERVLRLERDRPFVASDGAGRHRPCRIGPGRSVVVAGEVAEEPAPRPALTVAMALTKGERAEVAVQKLTELGVDQIVLMAAARSVAHWEGERAERRLVRLRRIAREASMQSRRVFLPLVEGVVPFAGAAALPGAALAERGGGPLSLGHPTVLVGPEGGWSDEELEFPLARVALGPHVLRAETAAMAAATILAALRHGSVHCA
ncbi:MAG: 16S rRNA (uracil(1498)-N(3))-methyltransferase [Acidimicrobiia bacterium]|nr:16S rRNA (uracil(1498)-N(3))-methyltransferase [Acidimicrobiia bacterium]